MILRYTYKTLQDECITPISFQSHCSRLSWAKTKHNIITLKDKNTQHCAVHIKNISLVSTDPMQNIDF